MSAAPVFVDTSALYAVLDADDLNHTAASSTFGSLLDVLADDPTAAFTHNGVITESAALVQRRLGMRAVRVLLDDVLPLLEVVWTDAELHQLATTALLAADQRQVSLVDWTSFVLMRRRGTSEAFAFDDDFTRQGFTLFGSPG
jgi:uncharacterized protein